VAPFNSDAFFGKSLSMVEPSDPLGRSRPSERTVSTKRAGAILASDALIPGFSSREADSFPGGPDAYREELHYRNGTKPRPRPKAKLDEEVDMAEATGEQTELAKLVEQYADAFKEAPSGFLVSAPQKLTTKTNDQFSIKPFIGGEEFEPVRAYVGKKHGTIIVFKPRDPCDFHFLEVPEKQCREVFGAGFPVYMRTILADVMEAKEELAAQAKRQDELEANAEKMTQYAEFGSW
jgi:hypothetical protein